MKQKLVIKVSMNGEKSRSKALKIAVGQPGVESVALQGDDKTQIVVTGDGVDSIDLTKLLRKKVGYSELVSVTEAGKDEKKEEKKIEQIVQPMLWSTYPLGVPQYQYYEPPNTIHDPNCTIM